ncbi:hypothetical protein D9611_003583 [Ephemerocybe angulata]|uniref:Uncharacterized protein n=1 Tax=Ephemerocybe angulata TaxID=980116 RepID=A0A8H5B5L9_9AGAR|nr:hypothetical protein D9611_003583 [Tulosesus angulatus]
MTPFFSKSALRSWVPSDSPFMSSICLPRRRRMSTSPEAQPTSAPAHWGDALEPTRCVSIQRNPPGSMSLSGFLVRYPDSRSILDVTARTHPAFALPGDAAQSVRPLNPGSPNPGPSHFDVIINCRDFVVALDSSMTPARHLDSRFTFKLSTYVASPFRSAPSDPAFISAEIPIVHNPVLTGIRWRWIAFSRTGGPTALSLWFLGAFRLLFLGHAYRSPERLQEYSEIAD